MLADEIDTLRGAIGEALAREFDERPEPQGEPIAEADRRRYQLRVFGMIRDQLPLTQSVVEAVLGDPRQESSDLAWDAPGLRRRLGWWGRLGRCFADSGRGTQRR